MVCACGEQDTVEKNFIVDLVLVVVKIVILIVEIALVAL